VYTFKIFCYPYFPTLSNLAFTTSNPVMRSLSPEDYTVGWICALPIELAASKTMLDETDTPIRRHPSDFNVYTVGRVGNHNVVIACLPAGQMGITSAATVAAQMKYSFGSIRFGLMVGIGGGVPTAKDIRLGDVVVSQPGPHGGGVVQYDFGKSEQGGRFVQTGSLNAPPLILLNALSNIQANHILGENKMAEYLSKIPPQARNQFKYIGADQDNLFKAIYRHADDKFSCAHCDATQLINRASRASTNPIVHYGIIASANRVMRDGPLRDRLSQNFGVFCFEMEAAG
jgi:nucleoside phosphorylase